MLKQEENITQRRVQGTDLVSLDQITVQPQAQAQRNAIVSQQSAVSGRQSVVADRTGAISGGVLSGGSDTREDQPDPNKTQLSFVLELLPFPNKINVGAMSIALETIVNRLIISLEQFRKISSVFQSLI